MSKIIKVERCGECPYIATTYFSDRKESECRHPGGYNIGKVDDMLLHPLCPLDDSREEYLEKELEAFKKNEHLNQELEHHKRAVDMLTKSITDKGDCGLMNIGGQMRVDCPEEFSGGNCFDCIKAYILEVTK